MDTVHVQQTISVCRNEWMQAEGVGRFRNTKQSEAVTKETDSDQIKDLIKVV